MRAFTVCGEGQLHDLHSKLHLNHPEGQAKQLHKYAPMALHTVPSFRGLRRLRSIQGLPSIMPHSMVETPHSVDFSCPFLAHGADHYVNDRPARFAG